MSRLAPFFSSARVASTLLTAAAQCKADLPVDEMSMTELNRAFYFQNVFIYQQISLLWSYHDHPLHWRLHGSAQVPPPYPPLPVWLPGWVVWCHHSYEHQDPWHGSGWESRVTYNSNDWYVCKKKFFFTNPEYKLTIYTYYTSCANILLHKQGNSGNNYCRSYNQWLSSYQNKQKHADQTNSFITIFWKQTDQKCNVFSYTLQWSKFINK